MISRPPCLRQLPARCQLHNCSSYFRSQLSVALQLNFSCCRSLATARRNTCRAHQSSRLGESEEIAIAAWKSSGNHAASKKEKIFAQVLMHESAASMWKALSSIFASSSQVRLQQLELQLRSLKKGSKTMTDFIQEAKHIAHQLSIASSPVSDQQLILSLLTGLGPDYSSLATAITTRLDLMNIDDFTCILLNHDLMYTTNTTADIPPLSPFANMAEHPKYQMVQVNTAFFRGRGRNRGRGRSRGRSFPPRANVICQLCNRHGHSVADCYYRQNPTLYPPTRPPPPYATNTEYYATNVTTNPWYLDSGASHHAIASSSGLQNATPPPHNANLQVADGSSLPIVQSGHSNKGGVALGNTYCFSNQPQYPHHHLA